MCDLKKQDGAWENAGNENKKKWKDGRTQGRKIEKLARTRRRLEEEEEEKEKEKKNKKNLMMLRREGNKMIK